jgi:hypothetical protein
METQYLLDQLNQPTLEYVWDGVDKKEAKKKQKKGEDVKIKRKKRGVLLAYVDGGENVVIGFSLCHKTLDKFDYIQGTPEPGFGIAVAAERAKKWKNVPKAGEVNIPHSLKYKLSNFVARCRNYYKDKELPAWTNHLVG